MKKIISLLLCLLIFVACSSSKEDSNKEEKTSEVENKVEKKESENSTENKVEQEVSVEETLLLDEQGIKITLNSIEKSLFGVDLKVSIENNSDKNVTIQTRNESVNGYMITTMFSCDVAPGKKANDEITLLRSDLQRMGIVDSADVEFYFHVYDSDEWKEIFDSDTIVVKTNIADTYEYVYDTSGLELYNADGILVVYKGLDNGLLGPCVILYIENMSDKTIVVQTRDESINGYMVDAMFSSTIAPKKRVIDDIDFLKSDLEKSGVEKVEDIEEIEISLNIFDDNTWNTIVETAPIIIEP